MMITRRRFSSIALGATATATSTFAQINSKVNGVRLGAQSYSFRDMDLDAALQAMKEIGIGTVEMFSGHVEPKGLRGEALTKWRLETPLSVFKKVRKKYDAAGIELYAYNYSFRDNFTSEEIEQGFKMARAMGVKVITASSNVSTAKKIDPFAAKYKIRVGMHNHSRIHDNEFATPDDFARAMNGTSEYICVNLDIGHFTAANFDPVDYLTENHAKIVTLHIKDRKKNQGPNTEFGQGDTPIKQVLAVLREKKLSIPANIEYEYKGADTTAEVRKCFEYCRKALS
ncbi:MAG: sugar phosphate isomerase/epimerase [Acidobacteria bacterium]|nr:sugar phosphate isomerase/epimerase [Acidobacteriota bacterium]